MKISTWFHDLFEAKGEKMAAEDDMSSMVSMLHKNCGPWIQAYRQNKQCFYRGYHTTDDTDVLLKRTRKNRSPRDSQVLSHRLFNRAMSVFGNNPKWRTNSVFTSTDETSASQYGPLRIMIPIGKYDALSSNKIVDLYTTLDPSSGSGANHIGRFIDGRLLDKSLAAEWIESIEKSPEYLAIANELTSFIEKYIVSDSRSTALMLSVERSNIAKKVLGDILDDTSTYTLVEILAEFGQHIYYFGSATAAVNQVPRHVLEFGLDMVSMHGAIRTACRKAGIDGEISLDGFAKFTEAREKFVRRLVISHSAELVQIYTNMIEFIIRNSYTYYPTPASITNLTDDQEIMIRCNEYYLVKPKVFDDIISELTGSDK